MVVEVGTQTIAAPVLRRLVELACLAPSVHNTQPWRWQAAGAVVGLYADRSLQLPAEDPSGRNLLISCGAALDHFRVAAAALALDTEISRFPDPADADLLAEVRLRPGHPSSNAAADIDLLRTRCTDRRRFTSWPVPQMALEQLVEHARASGTRAVAVTDTGARFRLEVLARRAQDARALDLEAVREQGEWVGRGGLDGIPLAVLPTTGSLASVRYGNGQAVDQRPLVDGNDGVIVLGGDADDPAAWLRTGEGLSRLWLQATAEGLSVVPLSLPIEIDATRQSLRDDVLGARMTPHLLVRIGWQAIGRSQLPRTPRRAVADVLRA